MVGAGVGEDKERIVAEVDSQHRPVVGVTGSRMRGEEVVGRDSLGPGLAAGMAGRAAVVGEGRECSHLSKLLGRNLEKARY